MKKIIAITLIALLAGIALAANGIAVTQIEETTGTTNYYGLSRTTKNTVGTISTNDAKWMIIRTITPSAGNSTTKNAYGSGPGDNSLWSTAWTNRVNATYK